MPVYKCFTVPTYGVQYRCAVTFYENLGELFKSFKCNCEVLVLGDFNINWLDKHCRKRPKDLTLKFDFQASAWLDASCLTPSYGLAAWSQANQSVIQSIQCLYNRPLKIVEKKQTRYHHCRI